MDAGGSNSSFKTHPREAGVSQRGLWHAVRELWRQAVGFPGRSVNNGSFRLFDFLIGVSRKALCVLTNWLHPMNRRGAKAR